ncbi:ClpP class serine protease [Pedobacter sp. UYP24]
MLDPFLSALLRGSWLIDESYALSSMPLAISVLNGSSLGSSLLNGNGDFENPFFVGPDGQRREAFAFFRGQMVFQPDNALPGSIAVVPFIGPMIKYMGSCGEPGMIQRQQWIGLMASLPNVVGYASILDTPGGQADGTPQTAKFIQEIDKPTAAIIIGEACSAGAWIASGHDEIFAADEFCDFGSIGAYQTIVDPRGKYENDGYKIRTVYPKISKDKNLSYRMAIDGDTSMVEEEVGGLAQSFVDGFRNNRLAQLKSDDWETGKVFNAKTATEMGMITGIKPMNEVFDHLRKISITRTKQQISNNSKMETKNIEALAGKESLSSEQLDLANAELTAAGVTNATIVTEAMITEATEATTKLATTKKDLETANTNLTASQSKVSELEGKLSALGKVPGATHVKALGKEDPVDPGKEDDDVISNLAHNKAAEAYLNS